jgi:Ca-activated chloride channel family protein
MNPEQWKPLISAYADHAVSTDEAAAAEKLLAENPDCRAYLDELRRLSSSLRVLDDDKLSPDAELKILSNINKERTMTPNNWKQMATVCATVLIALIVYDNTRPLFNRSWQVSSVPHPAEFGDRAQNIKENFARVETDRKVSVGHEATAWAPHPESENAKQSAVGVFQSAIDKSEATNMPLYKKAVASDAQSYQLNGSAPVRAFESRVSPVTAGAMHYSEAMKSKSAVPRFDREGTLGDTIQYEPYYTKELNRPAIDPAIAVYRAGQLYPGYSADTEEYATINDNRFLAVMNEPLSTFSIDVDTASYANLRRFLTQGQRPPRDAVKIEEMINYFSYDYPQPKKSEPFSVTADLALCPWNRDHQLLRIGLKGMVPDAAHLPASNLVFLIDVSGSMAREDKLPLLKEGFRMMVHSLRPEDKVSIVVYAGNAGIVLQPTSGADKDTINSAIDRLQSGGSTAGGAGIMLAYQLAREQFIEGGNNRVILATDGDFNVGISSTAEMEALIEDRRRDGVFLTVLGFGQGNVKDNRMETLADKGNGNYYYIDSLREAKKVLVSELGSTLFTIAKDVKVQVEFNPVHVKGYRLIGYENRMLAKEDFNDDRKDAGEIGAGHTVTALYELVPADSDENIGGVDALKYAEPVRREVRNTDEVLTVKLRYKLPDGDDSRLITCPVKKPHALREPAGDFAWVSAVAEFGMLLRDSEYQGQSSYGHVLDTASANIGEDEFGFRAEFIALVERAAGTAPDSRRGEINFK